MTHISPVVTRIKELIERNIASGEYEEIRIFSRGH